MREFFERARKILSFFYLLSFTFIVLLILVAIGMVLLFWLLDQTFVLDDYLNSEFYFLIWFAPIYIFLKWLIDGEVEFIPILYKKYLSTQILFFACLLFCLTLIGNVFFNPNYHKNNSSNDLSEWKNPLLRDKPPIKRDILGLVCKYSNDDTSFELRLRLVERYKIIEEVLYKDVTHYAADTDTFGNILYRPVQKTLLETPSEYIYQLKRDESGNFLKGFMDYYSDVEIVINRQNLNLYIRTINSKSLLKIISCNRVDSKEVTDWYLQQKRELVNKQNV